MHFEPFLGVRMKMFAIHTLVFTLWFLMVGPSFISSDDSFQEVVTFSTTAIQKPFADVQMLLFVQFFVLLWNPSRTDFMEGMPDVDTFIG
jgi:hypothetical protein